MKLHYSQTGGRKKEEGEKFYYHMKLHYSQTDLFTLSPTKQFYYHMKLHYSQTSNFKKLRENIFRHYKRRTSYGRIIITYQG